MEAFTIPRASLNGEANGGSKLCSSSLAGSRESCLLERVSSGCLRQDVELAGERGAFVGSRCQVQTRRDKM